jgi:hypothetical protein
MNMRYSLPGLALLFALLFALPGDVRALTPPSASDGPIKLLACVVSPSGKLQAQVVNESDDALLCNIRCNYELGGKMFSQFFSETIPKRFQGAIGSFDTSNARAGSYSGEVIDCKKTSAA